MPELERSVERSYPLNLERGRTRLRRFLSLVPLLAVFLVAAGIRLAHLGESRIISERQYESAVLARGFHFARTPSIPEWRRVVAAEAVEAARGLGEKEPPIMELLVSRTYPFTGRDAVWTGGLIASLFWLTGGVLLYRIASRVGPPAAALASTAYFLFAPLGMEVSVSFLPDSMMLMLLLGSVLVITRHHEFPSRRRLLVAVAVSGVAILVKPFVIFAVLAVFAGMSVARAGSLRGILSVESVLFAVGVTALGAAYYLYAILVSGALAGNVRTGFIPSVLATRGFWTSSLRTAVHAVEWGPLIVAIPGAFLFKRREAFSLISGLLVGYALFGVAYTGPFPHAAYYHVQLIVIVGLCLGPVCVLLLERLRSTSRLWWLPVLTSATLLALFAEARLRRNLASAGPIEPPSIAQEIGEIVNHSTRTVFVATYYGSPLQYHAEIAGQFWYRRRVSRDIAQYVLRRDSATNSGFLDWLLRRPGFEEVTLQERLDHLDFTPEYFIVTRLDRFERFHRDTAEFLETQCSLVSDSDEYLVYDLSDCVPSPDAGAD